MLPCHTDVGKSKYMIYYSVVVPLKDEEGNVEPLVEEVIAAMEALGQAWELICVDDGSTDGTAERLAAMAMRCAPLRFLRFDRNYGQSSAFDAGFKASRGRWIITLDGDLQNDPADIGALIGRAHATNADLVCGVRERRCDGLFKRWSSWIANAVRSRFCGDGMRDTGCSLKLYRKECLDKIKMFHGMHRFLPALFLIEGFTVEQLPVSHRERVRGKSKYGLLNRSLNTLVDMLAVRWMRSRRLRYRVESPPK